MYIVIVPIQVKKGFKEQFVEEIIADAKGSITNEPGCLRFDVVQDTDDANRIWLYEVYRDEAAFEAHTQTPHYIRWRDTTEDWIEEMSIKPVIGGSNIWPRDEDWK
jgi:autoinducer 2-degrading protein